MAALAVVGVGSCHVTRLESAVGRHIVIYWEPDDYRVCGGTLEYVDRSLEVVAQTYGLALPEKPAIDMFLSEDLSLALALCRVEAGGCTSTYPNGTALMVLDRPVHAHELTHALRMTGTREIMPRLFREGVAVRWDSGPTEESSVEDEYVADLDYAWLRAQIDRNDVATTDYLKAGFLWSWLEAEYGPQTMAGFASHLHRFSSADEIEREFVDAFGMSLEQAAEASRGSPMPMFDVHACAMLELPTLSVADEPLRVASGRDDCSDEDVVNIRARAVRFVRLELPTEARYYRLSVVGASSSAVRFDACVGAPRPYAVPKMHRPSPDDVTLELAGDYVVTSFAEIAEDGTVQFPTVELWPGWVP